MAIISGIFIVDELKDKDAEGFERVARVHNQMEEHMTADCFLPPYVRPSQCKIKAGSKVFAFVDTVSGFGVALYGFGDADVDFINRNNYTFAETLTVEKATTLHDKLDVTKDITSTTGNITAVKGDCIATTVSLKSHTHQIVLMPQNDVLTLTTTVMAGGAAPVTFATFYTITPT